MRENVLLFRRKGKHPVSNEAEFRFTFFLQFTFIRRFYPKRLTLHSSYSFYILSALAFPGNRTHDLGVASAMLYQLSYRKAVVFVFLLKHSSIISPEGPNYSITITQPTLHDIRVNSSQPTLMDTGNTQQHNST